MRRCIIQINVIDAMNLEKMETTILISIFGRNNGLNDTIKTRIKKKKLSTKHMRNVDVKEKIL